MENSPLTSILAQLTSSDRQTDPNALLSRLSEDPNALAAAAQLLLGAKAERPAPQNDSDALARTLSTLLGGGAPPPRPQGQASLEELLSSLARPNATSSQRGDGAEPSTCADMGGGKGDSPIKRLLGGKAEAENRIRLLNALRPYLSEERRGTVDTLLKLLKIAELGELSGLFGAL